MSGESTEKVEGFFAQIFVDSNLHGVKYLGLPYRHIVERLFLGLAVLSCLGYSIYLVAEVVRKYNDNPIIISFQPMETSVSQIPFPAITICNVNILKATVMREVFDELNRTLVESGYTHTAAVEENIVLSEYLAHHCLAAPSFQRLSEDDLIDSKGESDLVNILKAFLDRNYIITEQISPDAFEELYKEKTMNFSRDVSLVDEFHDMRMASPHCEDMILKCMWENNFIQCKDFFFPVATQHGACCVFNMMPRFILKNLSVNESRVKEEINDLPKGAVTEWQQFRLTDLVQTLKQSYSTKYPKHQKSGGKQYGLSILINPELDMYSTCTTNDAWGFKMLAHSPISFPSIMDYGVAIPPNSEVFINIEPEVTIAEPHLKSVNLNKRGCYLPVDENATLETYKFYTADNCKDECIAKSTYERCKCVRYFMPRNASQKMCGAKLLECAENVRSMLEVGSTGKANYCSKCLPACTEIRYKMQMSYFPLRDSAASVFHYNTSHHSGRRASNYSIVHVFLGTDSLYAKERKGLYAWQDLLANAGGLVSLTLGFSIISFIEVLYFCTLRAWFHLRGARAVKASQKEIAKLSAAVNPRASNKIRNDSTGNYYNWLSTTSVVTKQLAVVPAKSKFNSKLQQIPNFQLLANSNQPSYPFMS